MNKSTQTGSQNVSKLQHMLRVISIDYPYFHNEMLLGFVADKEHDGKGCHGNVSAL